MPEFGDGDDELGVTGLDLLREFGNGVQTVAELGFDFRGGKIYN